MAREREGKVPLREVLPTQENGEYIDPGRLFLTFTGQGSHFPGMGMDLYQNSQEAREVFHEADRIVGFPLSEIMFRDPEKTLIRTDIAQIAIVTFEEATRRTVEALSGRELDPKAFAGHSLGTYEAMVAAEVTSFPDTIRLAQARDLATASKAKGVTELQVNGAWHSSLMESTQEGLQKAISDIPFKDPKKHIYDNSTGELLTTAEGIQKALVRGLCERVCWNTLFKRGAAGASAVIEIGPRDFLSRFAKQMVDRSTKIIPVSSFESAQNLAHILQQPSDHNKLLNA